MSCCTRKRDVWRGRSGSSARPLSRSELWQTQEELIYLERSSSQKKPFLRRKRVIIIATPSSWSVDS